MNSTEIWTKIKRKWAKIKRKWTQQYLKWGKETIVSYKKALAELEAKINQRPKKTYDTMVPEHWKLQIDYESAV